MTTEPWWKRALRSLRRRAAAGPAAAEDGARSAGDHHRVELVRGQLAADVYRHDVQNGLVPIPCWTYVSDGLQRFGQPEIVFTLARTRGETLAPPQPIQLFRTIHDFARAGQIVGAGGVTQFGDDKFFGRHLTYIPAQRLPGIAIPSAAICAILVTADEVLAVGQFGSARVTARLGNAARYYPCPPWSDRSRPGIAFAATRRESMLARLETILRPGRGCGIHQADGEIVLRLGESARAALATQLERTPDGKTFGVLTEIEPDADACLVWQPGQSAMAAIAPPGSTGRHICGCMLLIAIGMQEDSVHQTEDGFGVVLTDASWRAVKDAIDRGERLRIAANGMPFVVDCIGG